MIKFATCMIMFDVIEGWLNIPWQCHDGTKEVVKGKIIELNHRMVLHQIFV